MGWGEGRGRCIQKYSGRSISWGCSAELVRGSLWVLLVDTLFPRQQTKREALVCKTGIACMLVSHPSCSSHIPLTFEATISAGSVP